MTASGKPIDDEEMISYILAGLDYEYNPIVSALVSRTDPLSVGEVYAQLLNFEQHMELLHPDSQPSANMATRGRGSQRGRGGGGCGRGGNRGRGHGNQPRHENNNNASDSNKPRCQLCKKVGHEVMDCWHRFEEDFVPTTPKKKYASMAYTPYGVDTNWYTDTGASHHVTGSLEKLSVHDAYKSQDQVHTASSAGMSISHIGHSIVHTPSRNLHLKNILHVPKASKNLVSVHRLASDISAFLEFHSDFFLIKDQATKKTLLRGRCHQGLYPMPTAPPVKQA